MYEEKSFDLHFYFAYLGYRVLCSGLANRKYFPCFVQRSKHSLVEENRGGGRYLRKLPLLFVFLAKFGKRFPFYGVLNFPSQKDKQTLSAI